ncbi:hypothetical protein Z043_120873, partial [Scleropages formosus]
MGRTVAAARFVPEALMKSLQQKADALSCPSRLCPSEDSWSLGRLQLVLGNPEWRLLYDGPRREGSCNPVWTVMTARFRLPAGRSYNVRASELARDRQQAEVLCSILLLDNTLHTFKVD